MWFWIESKSNNISYEVEYFNRWYASKHAMAMVDGWYLVCMTLWCNHVYMSLWCQLKENRYDINFVFYSVVSLKPRVVWVAYVSLRYNQITLVHDILKSKNSIIIFVNEIEFLFFRAQRITNTSQQKALLIQFYGHFGTIYITLTENTIKENRKKLLNYKRHKAYQLIA